MPSIHAQLTLGVELEVVKLSPQARELIAARSFGQHYDRTITGPGGVELPRSVEDGGGTELITQVLPIWVDMSQTGRDYRPSFGTAEDVVRDLCRCAQEVNTSCGLHVHIGRPDGDSVSTSKWDPKHVRMWLTICKMLEDRLFDLCPASRRNNRYCKKIDEEYHPADFTEFYPTGSVRSRKYDNTKRYCWLNLIETKREGGLGTVEIRMLGCARRYSYIWSWIKLWTQIAAYIAYVEPALAFGHCLLSESLKPAFDEVKGFKLARQSPQAAGDGHTTHAGVHIDEDDNYRSYVAGDDLYHREPINDRIDV